MANHIKSFHKTNKVLICHYRVGWTDGVSLEINKRKELLQEMGYEIYLLSGPHSRNSDFVLEELDFDNYENQKISSNSFNELKDFHCEEDLLTYIIAWSYKIKSKIDKILDEISPDFIFLHNIFSHGRHISCAKTFYDILEERHIPTIATHHDFYWEREAYSQTSCSLISNFLKKYVPPVIPGLVHCVINSIAERDLISKRGIASIIIPDTLDFGKDLWVKDEYNGTLLQDFKLEPHHIFILQATRIVKRKGIELMIPIIKDLNGKYLQKLMGKTLYNGKIISKDSRFVFLLAGYAEKDAKDYCDSLIKELESKSIPYRLLSKKVAYERGTKTGEKVYSLFDVYPYADLVSFPSLYEGWGNQFLEGIFAQKPIVLFEYPVFQNDIKDKSYHYISLGSQINKRSEKGLVRLKSKKIKNVCEEIVQQLVSNETAHEIQENFKLAKQNNSKEKLKTLLQKSMSYHEI